MKIQNKQLLLIAALLIMAIGVAMRLLPHPANFAPIAGLALFGTAVLDKRYGWLIALSALIISDLFLPNYSWTMRLSVYGSFMAVAALGLWVRKNMNAGRVVGASLLGSIIFYLTTNAAVWAFGFMYPKTLAGLMQSYYYALPFFRNTVIGDLFYSGVFFGAYALAAHFISVKRKNTATE